MAKAMRVALLRLGRKKRILSKVKVWEVAGIYTHIVLIPRIKIAKKALTRMSMFQTPSLPDAKPKRALPITPVRHMTMI